MNKIISLCIVLASLIASCNVSKKLNSSDEVVVKAQDSVKFTYQQVSGVGVDAVYNRGDNSDIIKVNNTYYMWYTRMESPQTSGYWGTIWYATSQDEGYTWQEQGKALGLGAKGTFDSHSVFTPNILVYNAKNYMYNTGVKATHGNPNKEFEGNSTTDITAIGLAVADSPDGPFKRVANNPVLEISIAPEDFDSFRIDDASLLVKDKKIWLYYKGRSIIHGKKGPGLTKMGVAVANNPEGPFKKHDKPLIDKGHEVMIWNENGGIASLASLSKSIHWAKDGLNFYPIHENLINIPMAPGLYRPDLEGGNLEVGISGWGICMRASKGETYLLRFEMK